MRTATRRLIAAAISLPALGGIILSTGAVSAHAVPAVAALVTAAPAADLADLQKQAASHKESAEAASAKLNAADAALAKAEETLATAAKRAQSASTQVSSTVTDVNAARQELGMVQFGANLARTIERRAELAEDEVHRDNHGLLGMTSITDLASDGKPSLANLTLEATSAERDATISALKADWAGVGARAELRVADHAVRAATAKRDEAAAVREGVAAEAAAASAKLKDAQAKVAEAEEAKRAAERKAAAEKAAREAKRKVQPGTGHTTSPYGMRTHPITRVYKLHSGTDFSYGDGQAYAARAGTVAATTYDGAYGNMVTISHGGGIQTRYAHLSRFNVSPGQKVSAGTVVGQIGTTGYSTGPHLHFEVLKNGSFVNADSWLGQ